jgi:hypothetical protein
MAVMTMQYAAIDIGAIVGVTHAELARVDSLPTQLMTVAGAIAGARVVRYRRQRQEEADDARTVRLVDALDAAAEADPSMQFEGDSFEAVLADGLNCGKCAPVYPPPGHGYPRGDR